MTPETQPEPPHTLERARSRAKAILDTAMLSDTPREVLIDVIAVEIHEREDAELLNWAWLNEAIKWNALEGAGWRLDMDDLGHDPTDGNLWLPGSWEDGPTLTDEAREVLKKAKEASG